MRLSTIFGGPGDWARMLSLATAAGVFMGVIGPFGSFHNDTLAVRIAFYTALAWIGAVMFGLVVRPAARRGPMVGFTPLFSLAVALLLVCLPLAAIVAVASLHFWPRYVASLSPLDWYAQTLFVSAPIVVAAVALERLAARPVGRGPVDNPVIGAPPGPSAFLDRLPPRLGRDLLCLQMEDHYVRAHTALGSDLILIPLRQAVAELGEIEGLQVHRSWWVSRAAVAGAALDGRTCKLALKGGLEAPVARSRIAVLRAGGWLDAP